MDTNESKTRRRVRFEVEFDVVADRRRHDQVFADVSSAVSKAGREAIWAHAEVVVKDSPSFAAQADDVETEPFAWMPREMYPW